MSRSFRHTPCYGHGGGSEKQDKRIYNRSLRARVRQMLIVEPDFDGVVLPEVRDVSNPWSMAKDGKSYRVSLARITDTLAKVTRLRDGRRRQLLTITDATIDAVIAENRAFAMRYSWCRRSFTEDRQLVLLDAAEQLRIFRK